TPVPQPTSSTDAMPSSKLRVFTRDGWVFPSGPARKKSLDCSVVQRYQFSFNLMSVPIISVACVPDKAKRKSLAASITSLNHAYGPDAVISKCLGSLRASCGKVPGLRVVEVPEWRKDRTAVRCRVSKVTHAYFVTLQRLKENGRCLMKT